MTDPCLFPKRHVVYRCEMSRMRSEWRALKLFILCFNLYKQNSYFYNKILPCSSTEHLLIQKKRLFLFWFPKVFVHLSFPQQLPSSINNNQCPKGLWLAFVLSVMYLERTTFVLSPCLMYWIELWVIYGLCQEPLFKIIITFVSVQTSVFSKIFPDTLQCIIIVLRHSTERSTP